MGKMIDMKQRSHRHIIFWGTFVIALLLLSIGVKQSPLVAQNNDESRPKIGLVLSGGGARGFAHIGALKVLEEEGIKPDIITGTSMGSIVGALYSIGYTSDQLDSLTRSLDWGMLFSDEVNHRLLSIQDKIWDGRFFVTFPANQKDGITLPKGLIAGQQISLLLTKLFWPYLDIYNFEDLPIPFGCVAMDLETGESVFLKEGFLTDAIRSSISIPTVFTPNLDLRTNQVLVDGGWAKNLPVTEAIEMGADIIIAVDVTSELYDRSKIINLLDVFEQTGKYRVLEINEQEKSYADILIEPTAKEFSGQDFNLIDTLISSGYHAADSLRSKLTLVKSKIQPNTIQKPQIQKKIQPIYISKVSMSGVDEKSVIDYDDYFKNIEGRLIYPEDIDQMIQSLYARGDFMSIKHLIFPDESSIDSGFNLHLQIEKNTDSALKIGLRYDNETQASILLQAANNNVLSGRSKLLATVRLGEDKYYQLQHSQLSRNEWFGYQLSVNYQNRTFDLFENLNKRTAAYTLNQFTSAARLGSIIDDRLLISGGLRFDSYTISNDLNLPTNQIRTTQSAFSFETQLFYDYLDRVWFPRKGQKWDIRFIGSNKILQERVPYSYFQLKHRIRFTPIKEFTWGTDFIGVRTTGQNIPAYLYSFAPNDQFGLNMDYIFFYGQRRQRISGRNLIMISAIAQYNISRTSILGFHYSAGKTAEAANIDNINTKDLVEGFAMSYGNHTLIGPIQFFLGSGTNQGVQWHIRIGYDF